ncbi:MAG: serine/threonine protein kinase [Candidatus Wallbacteria bacterium]|nr:serine/threonine protein kinase [Candidatus Wallbacteria bacterium]
MIQVPGYRILETLGSGASGTVYRAEQVALGRQVALKVLAVGLFDAEQTRARFLREARLQARLSHPRLLALFDAGFAGGRPYLATELVEAGSLRDRLAAAGKLEPGEAARIARGIAEGLAAAHEAGIVHRDLKPENVLLTQTGEVKLADFGLAKPVDGGRTYQSAAGIVLGTPGYLAPEVVDGAAAGPAADLFALGAVFYEMLCGATAWASGSDLAQLFREQRESRSRPLRAGVPERLAHLVTELIEADPAARPPSAQAVVAALEAYEQERSSESIDVSRPTAIVRAAVVTQPRLTQISGPPGLARLHPYVRLGGVVAVAAAVLGLLTVGRNTAHPPGPLPAQAPPAPAPPAPLPRISALFRGTGRAAFKLDAGAPPGTLLTVYAARGGWQCSTSLATGARQAAVSGLAANQAFTARLSAPGVNFTTSFTTLGRASWGDASAIQPDAVCVGLACSARGSHIAVAGTHQLTDEKDCVRLQESEDGGLTWAQVEAPLGDAYATSVAVGIGSDALYLTGHYILAGKWGARRDAFLLGRGAGESWHPARTDPALKWPCQMLLPRPPDSVEALYVEPAGRSIVSAIPKGPSGQVWSGKLLASAPDNSVALRAAHAGSRTVIVAQRLGNVFGFRMLDTAIVREGHTTSWSPLVDRHLRIDEFEIAACGETTVVVYEADGNVLAQALAPGAEKFSGPVLPLAVVRNADARGCGLAVLQGRFYLACVTKSPDLMASLGGPDAIVVVSSADGLVWKMHRRVPLDLSGEIRCMSLVAVDDALVVLLSSRNTGVYSARVGLR